MGLNITFEFADGEYASSYIISWDSWKSQFQPLFGKQELRKCFEGDDFIGACTDKDVCIKLYGMLMVTGLIQEGLRLDDYPVVMYFT